MRKQGGNRKRRGTIRVNDVGIRRGLRDCVTPSFTDPGETVCPPAQIPAHRTIRCVVAHELTLLRQGVRRLLEDEPGLEMVAEAENAAQALRHVLEHRPDVVIADATLFGCAPAEAERMIVRESPETRVVFLPSAIFEERRPGAQDPAKYAVRQTSAEELVVMVKRSAERAFAAAGEVSEFPAEVVASRK